MYKVIYYSIVYNSKELEIIYKFIIRDRVFDGLNLWLDNQGVFKYGCYIVVNKG